MNRERLAAFTDAVVAIAATIMVLELAVPSENDWRGMMEDATVFVAYVVSFSQIYLVWKNHHDLFEKAETISQRTFVLNGIWLFFCTLVPFNTRWIGEASDSLLPELLYVLNLALWSVMFQIMDFSVLRDNPKAKPDSTNQKHFRLMLYGGFALAAVLALIRPRFCMIVMFIFTMTEIFWMIARGDRQSA
jgi:uncharacterized membrane protein